MAKNTPSEENENIGEIPQTPLVIHTQYLKDMSFENPNAPGILKKANQQPSMDMGINMNVTRLEDKDIEYLYEVTITINASAMRDDQTMFLAEITYGAAVSINGVEEKKHHPILLIEVPHLIYPFMRPILANATQAGGFTALQSAPVDFRNLYLERFANKEEDAKKEDSGAS